MRSCSENGTKATKVGIGIDIGIETHISTIPVPTPNVFMHHRVGPCAERLFLKKGLPERRPFQ